MSLRGRPACTKYFRSYINIGAIYSHGNHTVLDWEYDDVTNLTVTYTIVSLPVPLLFSAIIHNTSEFWKHICNTRSACDWVTSIVVKYTGVGTHVPRWLASCIWEHFLWFMSSPSCRTGLLMQIEFAHDWNYFAFGCLFNVAMCRFPFFGYFFFRLRHANCFGMVVLQIIFCASLAVLSFLQSAAVFHDGHGFNVLWPLHRATDWSKVFVVIW